MLDGSGSFCDDALGLFMTATVKPPARDVKYRTGGLSRLWRCRLVSSSGMSKSDKVRVRRISSDGRTTGFEIDYRDGRKAAVVRPATVHVSSKESTSR